MNDREQRVVQEDWALSAVAYVEFFVKGDRESMRLMEKDARWLSRSVGSLAFWVQDNIVLPCMGFPPDTSYIDMDFARRRCHRLAQVWMMRSHFRRQGLGRTTLRPRRRARHTAQYIAEALCANYPHQHEYPQGRMQVCDVVPAILADLRKVACRTSDE